MPGPELTRTALDELLRRLHPDSTQAGEEYIRLRDKLISYFEFEALAEPEALADTVIDRIARRVSEGEQIERMGAYALGVARFVAREVRQQKARVSLKLREFLHHPANGAPQQQPALDCLDRCMSRLPAENRSFILTYYAGDHAGRIETRKRMASQLGIASAALRNRALRLRGNLEACLKRCLRLSAAREME